MPLDPVTRQPALAIATQLPDDLPAPPTQAQLEALVAELSSAAAASATSAGEAGKGLVLIRSGSELERLSRDFFSYSPVLTPLLQDRLAQLVVKASSTEQVQLVAGACARHRVPITLRGSGTGNYGQCVPLAGGVVLDLSGLKRVRQLDSLSGVLTAEAGCLLADLEQQLAPHGRELRLTPSTRRSASLGGFIAGGSGGIGSVRWGFLRDPGNLLGLEVVTVEPEPRLLQLDASASAPLNHAYGSNGILTAVTVATAPAVPWQQLVIDFSSWTAAVAAIRALPATALLLNGLCLLEAAVARNLPCPEGHGHRLLLLAAPDALPALEPLLRAMGGRLVWQAPERGCRGVPLRELCWNHTTLHMRAHDPGWTYLQMLLPQPEAPALEALKQNWGDDLLWHLEAVRQQGCQRLAALPLVRWRGPEALLELMEQARQLGALLFNPHVFTVEDGGLGVIDADQVAAKHTYDPAGLLNPGKLRGWSER
ncbi:FAD-binding oxidoreductase [Synechococcus sp. Cruz-9H2]|uniref:FAD-binding oxidoreductase n=1 Tax=unclassified Synechococcus TaxID=2626047 RepID=UPI0020CD373A|nr:MULTISPECIES: FAD-binding oxidoreductase [unclassified Synechococcus]MCP9818760.1 FAD-binding oxidoreductase [Synechococcus sp. Cruz-9H2]MCP9842990.1 FAD-binding oxidoreductase [Synechococcus sp. Edmonson 11F2]MCP9856015.1 FAD-binding oxidoreductase [Synechococcus sp. Cruz-9C9]MCP9862098.1 FAD-binding oxidoreductase [Synechococcus sp. Cruz-7E5]MCP9869369.1 FAD-binding oxidoreductase [Synechococcus sp. Cruz-7B9]